MESSQNSISGHVLLLSPWRFKQTRSGKRNGISRETAIV
ncbi:hypothetical protein OESDEN_25027 [Oesophagostomum dentatum]|uniref:Uncharacterized protein n=1 Tax=Oesophagostomum dentatum TaxID=61180 RepID=A0A0B1RW00_OESDE|nr:hypothetical protein OESDEN_25027 [Oesophagostomum dentatum]